MKHQTPMEIYQGTAQINYCDVNVPYTRITEHKHFTPWENHDKTIYFKEYSKETTDTDIPYYPKRLEKDIELLRKYRNDAQALNKTSFLGRLATYRYMDMHHVIGEALQFSNDFISLRSSSIYSSCFSQYKLGISDSRKVQ